MATERSPEAAPQAEFIAVTVCSPPLSQEIWTVLPVRLLVKVPPDAVQLQPEGFGVQTAASAVKVRACPGCPKVGPPMKMLGDGLPVEFHLWMSRIDSAER